MIVRIGLQNRGKQLSQSRVSRLGLSNTVLLNAQLYRQRHLQDPSQHSQRSASEREKALGERDKSVLGKTLECETQQPTPKDAVSEEEAEVHPRGHA